MTLANVGERAGYSRGLATHHFGSKGALMQRLVDAVTLQFREAIFEESQSDSPMDEGLRPGPHLLSRVVRTCSR